MSGDRHGRSGPKDVNRISARLHNYGMRRLINYAVSDARCSARVIFDDHLWELTKLLHSTRSSSGASRG